MLHRFPRFFSLITFALAAGIACGAAQAGVTLLGVQYRADQAFPEHECFWHESQFPGPCGPSAPLGASVHLFLLNTGPSPVTVQDMELAGISLKQALFEEEQVKKRHPVSIYFALKHGVITPEQFQTLLDAGEPVWYKADPITIAPGTAGQVMVRLRQVPVTPSVSVEVVHSAGSISTAVTVDSDQPRLAGVSFSLDLTKVYLYWRRAQSGVSPSTVLMDGLDVTASVTQACDPAFDVCPSVLQLAQPLVEGSFHVFQGIYTDGEMASAGLRAWGNELCYGMWGAWPGNDDEEHIARAYIQDVTNHMINTQVVTLGSGAVQTFLKTAEGQQFAADHGLGFVINEIGKWGVQDPYLWFIRDEPDCADSRVDGLPSGKQVGSLAQMAVERADYLHSGDPSVLTMLNINGTYKPYNWYNYGQVPDVLATDPYYQARLRTAFWDRHERIPLYSKATYIYAVSQLAQSSCEPNPLHVILYSCKYVDSSGQSFPYPTPESKRIEVYYALAGGAKGLSYWWYIPRKPSYGVGAATVKGDPEAAVLWQEMALVGAEARTLGPVLATSCPAEMTIQTSEGLWARSLIAGLDTIVLLAVNDEYSNDEQGCHYDPLVNASLTVDLPTWIQSPTVFEITSVGPRDVSTQISGNQLQVNLGPVNLTRMIVVTSNTQLRTQLQQRYDEQFRTKVCNLDPTDTDGDGLNNTCDICPNDPLNDIDGDSVCGDVDNCPDVANLDQLDTDEDGAGDACDPAEGACCRKTGAGQIICSFTTRNNCENTLGGTYSGDYIVCGPHNQGCDFCPDDPDKDAPGICGCGVPDTDTDQDGTPDCNDECPDDPNKTEPGSAGCGVAEPGTDKKDDADDECPDDPNKTEPGVCGCGIPDDDTDGDGTLDCNDYCPNDPNRVLPGVCGCGVPDTDTDGDGTPDCIDHCPNDPQRTEPGACGCGVAETDTDGDGTPDCIDACPTDPGKSEPGACGCGSADTDSDGDGVPDCVDNCPNHPNPGQTDADADGAGDACDSVAVTSTGSPIPAFIPNCGWGAIQTLTMSLLGLLMLHFAARRKGS